MSTWAAIKVIISILPEIFDFIKWAINGIQEGRELMQIKADFKSIQLAMNNPDRKEAARELNDVFRKK